MKKSLVWSVLSTISFISLSQVHISDLEYDIEAKLTFGKDIRSGAVIYTDQKLYVNYEYRIITISELESDKINYSLPIKNWLIHREKEWVRIFIEPGYEVYYVQVDLKGDNRTLKLISGTEDKLEGLIYPMSEIYLSGFQYSSQSATVPINQIEKVNANHISDTEIQTTVDQEPESSDWLQLVHYPAYAKDHGIEGTVTLSFVVWSTGRLDEGSIKIISSSGSKILDDAAIRALKKSSWSPAKLNGRSVSFKTEQPVSFRLR